MPMPTQYHTPVPAWQRILMTGMIILLAFVMVKSQLDLELTQSASHPSFGGMNAEQIFLSLHEPYDVNTADRSFGGSALWDRHKLRWVFEWAENGAIHWISDAISPRLARLSFTIYLTAFVSGAVGICVLIASRLSTAHPGASWRRDWSVLIFCFFYLFMISSINAPEETLTHKELFFVAVGIYCIISLKLIALALVTTLAALSRESGLAIAALLPLYILFSSPSRWIDFSSLRIAHFLPGIVALAALVLVNVDLFTQTEFLNPSVYLSTGTYRLTVFNLAHYPHLGALQIAYVLLVAVTVLSPFVFVVINKPYAPVKPFLAMATLYVAIPLFGSTLQNLFPFVFLLPHFVALMSAQGWWLNELTPPTE